MNDRCLFKAKGQIAKKGVSVLNKERLTERSKKGIAMVKGCGENCEYGFSYCRKDEWENCKTISDLIDKLAEYEDLEEQGLILRLPCKVGDMVYTFKTVSLCSVGICHKEVSCSKCRASSPLRVSAKKFALKDLPDFGKTVFLTQSEAEEKLRELEGK